jgi:hypothetical protein
MRIIVFTEYGDNFREIASITTPVMREYCDKHGYEFRELILEGTGNEYYYKKHEFIRDIFENDEADACFYLDCDAIIANHKIEVESFFQFSESLIITEHNGELNGGAIIIKNTPKGKALNYFILSYRNEFQNEQNILNHYKDKLILEYGMRIFPHPAFNSLDYSQYPEFPILRSPTEGHFVEGCFVLHTPALALSKRAEILRNTKIIR